MSRSSSETPHRHYAMVEKAIHYIRHHSDVQPSLADVARSVNISEHHLQRIFSEWAGISPKRFLQSLTKQAALDAIKESDNLLVASDELGLSGSGRLHDLMVNCVALTPGEIRQAGEGVTIEYGVADTPFGQAVIGWTKRGICYLQFAVSSDEANNSLIKEALDALVMELHLQWPNAHFALNHQRAMALSDTIFGQKLERGKIHLVLKGTNFQIKVWEAMINTPPAQQYTYGQVAKLIGSPQASRAVGTALAHNTIGYLIPCHRVIRGDGDVGQFRWGSDRKAAIQTWEKGRKR
jgi:AraC family transcriptional regulator, regulatory protein of adaptative response / methylated-DNA-[protein]-cysteine methyltransferase